MKHQVMMDSLLSMSMQRGKLTSPKLNTFPADSLPNDELERFFGLLDGLCVRVIVIQRDSERSTVRQNYS
ncbi:MAG: hypothetical protein WAV13_09845 [Thermodesulfovibrionales bacterium]